MDSSETKTESVRSGRKCVGSNLHGHATDSSNEEDKERIRIGRNYQAVVPECLSKLDRRLERTSDHAILLWSPALNIPDLELDEYICITKEKHGYNGEQALGMLFWHNHDLNKATTDLTNFKPLIEEWTLEDKVMFEMAYQLHGKCFQWMKSMLPHKTLGSLVKYYYTWKKKVRVQTSLIDRQIGKLDLEKDSSDSDSGDNKETVYRSIRRRNATPTRQNCNENNSTIGGKRVCCSCRNAYFRTHITPKGIMCSPCFRYWRRTGSFRPMTSYVKRKLPRDMNLSSDDFEVMAATSIHDSSPGDKLLKSLDREIVTLMRRVQNNKQHLSSLKRKTSEGVNKEFCLQSTHPKINTRWTTDELLLAVQGVRKYGKDFQAIAEVLGTKTEDQVSSFFYKYRCRYNLDAVMKEFEAENVSTISIDVKLQDDLMADKVKDSSGSDDNTTNILPAEFNKH